MANEEETILGIKVGSESVTWGQMSFDRQACVAYPSYGYYKRTKEVSVLPYAVGCQLPTEISEYQTVLQVWIQSSK